MIKKIVQTWKTYDLSGAPPLFELSRNSWQEVNHGWAYRLMDDKEIGQYVATRLPGFYNSVYTRYEAQIQRVDIFRIVYMFFEGGAYSDLDAEALLPLENDFTDLGGVVLGTLGNKESSQHIPNAFLYSGEVHGEFWAFVLALACQRFRLSKGYDGAEYLTGPQLLTTAYYNYVESSEAKRRAMIDKWIPEIMDSHSSLRNLPIQLLDPACIYPLDWTTDSTAVLNQALRNRMEHKELPDSVDSKETICINYWTHSWEIPERGLRHALNSKLNWLISKIRK
jgi:hypothetical protein